MLRSAAVVFCLALSAGIPASATSPKDFLIHNDDGYGTSDCLARASSCGKIVADAWCEAKGFAKAVSYRPAEATDITSSTGLAGASIADAFVISCSE